VLYSNPGAIIVESTRMMICRMFLQMVFLSRRLEKSKVIMKETERFRPDQRKSGRIATVAVPQVIATLLRPLPKTTVGGVGAEVETTPQLGRRTPMISPVPSPRLLPCSPSDAQWWRMSWKKKRRSSWKSFLQRSLRVTVRR